MKIQVEHEIPYNKLQPSKCISDGDFEGNEVCKYHVFRDRTHGNKKPVERKVPKCVLFEKWLDGNYCRCPECQVAISKTLEKEKSTKNIVRCPHCGESYYEIKYSMSTDVYYPPIYKNGVNVNPDRNVTTTYCQCMNCGKEFTY